MNRFQKLSMAPESEIGPSPNDLKERNSTPMTPFLRHQGQRLPFEHIL